MAPSIIISPMALATARYSKNRPINNSAQPDSLGSTTIQLSRNSLMFKKTILGASPIEIKNRKITRPQVAPRAQTPYHGYAMNDFIPSPLFRNPHAMTLAAAFWRRKFPGLPHAVSRLFEIEPGTKVRADCHMQDNPRNHSTIVLLHGLEGSSDSGYMRGIAEKAWLAGFNVIRLNQRNCGGTENLTATL